MAPCYRVARRANRQFGGAHERHDGLITKTAIRPKTSYRHLTLEQEIIPFTPQRGTQAPAHRRLS